MSPKRDQRTQDEIRLDWSEMLHTAFWSGRSKVEEIWEQWLDSEAYKRANSMTRAYLSGVYGTLDIIYEKLHGLSSEKG